MDKREIEVKIQVTDFSDFKNKLEALGCVFSEPIFQEDTVYAREGISYDNIPLGEMFLRIRKQGGKIIFTLKKPQSNELDCIEKELIVDDEQELIDIINLLGYREVITIKKRRQKTKWNDLEICLDMVEDLGNFIEVEKLSIESGEKIQEELYVWLESFGFTRPKEIIHGYDVLVYNILKNK
ncbi:MAG: class IV adenylate cyclase [Planctomycetes bacterium]|jgi:adenylate cyclase class 2|nr:class IV adenylate cyclase [Planctomycetota bacterium]